VKTPRSGKSIKKPNYYGEDGKIKIRGDLPDPD
jgi:hypothetical protein